MSALLCISGCNSGSSTTNPSISASVTSGDCMNMSNSSTCIISIVYNTNGVGGISLNYNSTPSPLPSSITSSGTFNTTFGSCQSAVATSTGQVTCPVTVQYTGPNSGGTNASIAFTLGSATSNTIVITGN